MYILNFDNKCFGDIGYMLGREMLSVNRGGGYMNTTIACCNTRKYHGLMVLPADEPGGERNLALLSALDETVTAAGVDYELATHRFPGTYSPQGYMSITGFSYAPVPTITYAVGDSVLRKEMLFVNSRPQLMIRYTLSGAASSATLRLRPFMAFRDSHSLTRRNTVADGRAYPVGGGVKCRMYEHFPWLDMRLSPGGRFIASPDWYYDFEYDEERDRGYPYTEDLLTPGYFETAIGNGESVIFCCSTDPASPDGIARQFETELTTLSDRADFLTCLRRSARQFIVRRDGGTEVVAGYPWFGRWGRDTFIALPGITLSMGDVESCREVIATMTGEMRGGLFPNMGSAYNSADAPLWFFHTLQRLETHIGGEQIWLSYGAAMKEILDAYCNGTEHINVDDNGLVWVSWPGHAMTWMDAVVGGIPVTGRDGYQVEINALWYNAVCYTLDLAHRFGDRRFTEGWKYMPESIKASFLNTFWLSDGHLADYVDREHANDFVRPNQIIACSLDYRMLDPGRVTGVLDVVGKQLLTPRGLRTLSPNNSLYQGRYGGDQSARDRQYHQGTAWPWLLEHYVSASFHVYGPRFAPQAREILMEFENDIASYGIGSVCEIYDGDEPQRQRGATSQAWSVGALLEIGRMIGEYAGGYDCAAVTGRGLFAGRP